MAKSLVQSKSKLPEVHPGDIIRVHQKIKEGDKERVQVFEGIVIKTHGQVGPNASFTVRKIASGVGVERTYLLQSPNIVKIEFKKGSQVRRAKLYYLRDLSGKALKMKDQKIDRDVWELVAATEEDHIPTEEELAEAVEAAKKEEVPATPPTEGSMTAPAADDTVEAEVPTDGSDKTEENPA
jgi:large subunit ribosomal protein L19